MTRWLVPIVVSPIALLLTCGGGGSTGGTVDPSPSPIVASFTAAQPSPGALTVSMSSGGSAADVAVVRIDVTGVSGVWGAA